MCLQMRIFVRMFKLLLATWFATLHSPTSFALAGRRSFRGRRDQSIPEHEKHPDSLGDKNHEEAATHGAVEISATTGVTSNRERHENHAGQDAHSGWGRHGNGAAAENFPASDMKPNGNPSTSASSDATSTSFSSQFLELHQGGTQIIREEGGASTAAGGTGSGGRNVQEYNKGRGRGTTTPSVLDAGEAEAAVRNESDRAAPGAGETRTQEHQATPPAGVLGKVGGAMKTSFEDYFLKPVQTFEKIAVGHNNNYPFYFASEAPLTNLTGIFSSNAPVCLLLQTSEGTSYYSHSFRTGPVDPKTGAEDKEQRSCYKSAVYKVWEPINTLKNGTAIMKELHKLYPPSQPMQGLLHEWLFLFLGCVAILVTCCVLFFYTCHTCLYPEQDIANVFKKELHMSADSEFYYGGEEEGDVLEEDLQVATVDDDEALAQPLTVKIVEAGRGGANNQRNRNSSRQDVVEYPVTYTSTTRDHEADPQLQLKVSTPTAVASTTKASAAPQKKAASVVLEESTSSVRQLTPISEERSGSFSPLSVRNESAVADEMSSSNFGQRAQDPADAASPSPEAGTSSALPAEETNTNPIPFTAWKAALLSPRQAKSGNATPPNAERQEGTALDGAPAGRGRANAESDNATN
ncbi:unnamed protein product [Amoebophrya sp. A120]|nr:unnamed protein product [Amoebophrya sp. A120]|eukprot:GSA120T00004270001.1